MLVFTQNKDDQAVMKKQKCASKDNEKVLNHDENSMDHLGTP